MADLISRSEAIADLKEWLYRKPRDEFEEGFNNALNGAIERIGNSNVNPALDVAPVVHASWISEAVTKKDWKGRTNYYYQPCSCSVCHEPAFREYKYCPNCGARMDGEAHEA